MRRIALLGKRSTKALSKFSGLKSRLAYPDQFLMPLKRSKIQCGWYPKKLGFGENVIHPLTKVLESAGVDFFFGTNVTAISKVAKGFDVTMTSNEYGETKLTTKKIIWCAPVIPLARLLNIQISKRANGDQAKAGRKKYFASVLMKGFNSIDPVYYFYVYEPGFSIFRITNYCAYSDDPQIPQGHFLLGIEYWVDEINHNDADLVIGINIELESLGITRDSEIIKTFILPPLALPPEPDSASVDMICALASQISASDLGCEIALSGPFVRNNVFFLQDVLRDLKIELDSTIRKRMHE